MIKILIATHGELANGILSAGEIIVGQKDNITCLNAYSDVKNVKETIANYFHSLLPNDQVIVLTDLFGGSVNQLLMPYTQRDHIYLITGLNLAILLEIAMIDQNSEINENLLRKIVHNGQKQVMYVNDILKNSHHDDFE